VSTSDETRPIDARRFRDGLHGLSGRTPFSFPAESVPPNFSRAAVLLPFWEDGGDICVALIRRAESLRIHPGEVAFAGGIVDPGESFAEAAVREALEEIDLDPTCIEFLGRLDDAWSGFGHHIAPVVAWLSVPPKLTPNPAEVAEILTAPLSELLLPEARSVEELTVAGLRYTNVTLRWSGGSVDRLYSDLLLEAIGWGLGERPSAGRSRLQSMLESHEILSKARRQSLRR
jgi:8-oxo-dGTP pyrophosphatase MutT (NUDIX family)